MKIAQHCQQKLQVINRGKGNRSTFATNMNEHSSRSHLVLSVYVTGSSRTSSAYR
jgi:kinesin family protein C2/C3